MNKIIENPLISVLLSVYNDDKNIQKSIDSILSQSYKNIELLVIDDCSTDNTYKIINEIKDIRVRIFRNKNNQGLTKSLNTLIKESKGQILARQDSDDISLPNRLEIQYNELPKISIRCLYNKSLYKRFKTIYSKILTFVANRYCKKIQKSFYPWNFNGQENAILNVGMYDENMKYAQDYKLFLELLKRNYKIKILNKKLYVLNMKNNISSLKKEEQQSFFRKIQQDNL